jgi:hypothetical protein
LLPTLADADDAGHLHAKGRRIGLGLFARTLDRIETRGGNRLAVGGKGEIGTVDRVCPAAKGRRDDRRCLFGIAQQDRQIVASRIAGDLGAGALVPYLVGVQADHAGLRIAGGHACRAQGRDQLAHLVAIGLRGLHGGQGDGGHTGMDRGTVRPGIGLPVLATSSSVSP